MLEENSCIVLGGEICAGNGQCIGNGTCICDQGYHQRNDMHLYGTYSNVESAPCLGDETLVQFFAYLTLLIYGGGITFQLSIIRTLPQLARTLPMITGYSLILFPTIVKLWIDPEIGLLTNTAYTCCIAFGVASFMGGVSIFLTKYIGFIMKSTKKANFAMSKETIAKIKLGNVLLRFLVPGIYIVTQLWTVAAAVEDRKAKRMWASAGWIGFGLFPVFYGLIAEYSFKVISVSFQVFLESAKRMSKIATSTAPSKSEEPKSGEESVEPTSPKTPNKRASVFQGMFRKRSSVAPKEKEKDQTVKRIQAQLNSIQSLRKAIPGVTISLFVLGCLGALVPEVSYRYSWIFPMMLSIWGIFLVGSTVMMYNLGTRKRTNDAIRRETQMKKQAKASNNTSSNPSLAASSTASSTTSS